MPEWWVNGTTAPLAMSLVQKIGITRREAHR